MTVSWTFAWHDEEWLARRNPPASENLQLAVETLIIPLGRHGDRVEQFLKMWHAMEREHGTEYSVSTMSAVAERVSRDTVEIVDLYGQFTDVRLPAEEFVTLMTDLAATMRNR